MTKKVSQILTPLANAAFGKDWVLYRELLDHWDAIMGTEYGRFLKPIKISFPPTANAKHRCHGTLHLEAPKGLLLELTYAVPQIRERLNTYLGSQVIETIHLNPSYTKAPPNLQKRIIPEAAARADLETKNIESNDLKDALKELGELVYSDSQTHKLT